jgi:hypothetical protein
VSLKNVAKELEKAASINGVEILVDETAINHSFIPVINDKGIVGAVGEYIENKKIKIGFFILNNKIVRYALDEGFDKEQLFECFKDKLFDEIDKSKFFKIMTEKSF